MKNELEIATILKHVADAIKQISLVEGEMLMPVKIGNCVFIKYKNENRYKIQLPTKSTDIVTLDGISPSDFPDQLNK